MRIPLKKLTVSVSLVDAKNTTLWQTRDEVKDFRFVRVFRGDENPAQVMLRDLWGYGVQWACGANRPRYVFTTSDGRTVALPGSSPLPGAGS